MEGWIRFGENSAGASNVPLKYALFCSCSYDDNKHKAYTGEELADEITVMMKLGEEQYIDYLCRKFDRSKDEVSGLILFLSFSVNAIKASRSND